MSSSRLGFRVCAVYRLKKHGVLRIARQKLSFLVASLSIAAFVVGNMVGQHGWYAFWRSVLGKENDSLIVFVGTVPPIEKVPDYSRWAQYGGNSADHSYSQVPKDVLVPLPTYDPVALQSRSGENMAKAVYSIGNLGSYASGEDRSGSHVGVDIRVPRLSRMVSWRRSSTSSLATVTISSFAIRTFRILSIQVLLRRSTRSTLTSAPFSLWKARSYTRAK
jgi:hypothetical protein